MSRESRELTILGATVLAAFAVLAATAMLVADAAVARQRAPLDAARIAALEERAHTDAEAAAELAAERSKQTETSLRREIADRRLGWVLLVAAAAFVTGAKRLLTRQAPATTNAPVASPDKSPSSSPFSKGGGPDSEPDVDLAFVDDLVAEHGRGREAAIPLLQALQDRYRYLPDAALRRLCEVTEITPAQLAGTSTFYARFRDSPVGEHLVRLCQGTACHVAGAGHVDGELRRRLGIPPGADTDPGRRFTLEPVACVGCCSLAPVMMIGDRTAGHLTPATAGHRLQALAEEA
jgi:NADH:ubiquinone oxidoreductase subunit E